MNDNDCIFYYAESGADRFCTNYKHLGCDRQYPTLHTINENRLPNDEIELINQLLAQNTYE